MVTFFKLLFCRVESGGYRLRPLPLHAQQLPNRGSPSPLRRGATRCRREYRRNSEACEPPSRYTACNQYPTPDEVAVRYQTHEGKWPEDCQTPEQLPLIASGDGYEPEKVKGNGYRQSRLMRFDR